MREKKMKEFETYIRRMREYSSKVRCENIKYKHDKERRYNSWLAAKHDAWGVIISSKQRNTIDPHRGKAKDLLTISEILGMKISKPWEDEVYWKKMNRLLEKRK